MQTLFSTLHDLLCRGHDTVLVTVVASSGSTPRGAGARMLITADGRQYGTIGGGAVEFHSEQLAQDVLRSKGTVRRQFRLYKNQVQDLGMICGGDVDVCFRFLSAGDSGLLALTERAADFFRTDEESWLIEEIADDSAGVFGLYGRESGAVCCSPGPELLAALHRHTGLIHADGRTYYCERLISPGRVYIFGGGHVSQALVPALAAVGFRCVVLEDRPEFCRPALFPGAVETRLVDLTRIADYITVKKQDYAVIMTRGHQFDQILQAQMMHTPACYIGVIGSRRKSTGVFANLRAQGFSDADLARITTPIGLDIRAETPAEIAVSITAQLICKRAALAAQEQEADT